MQIRKITRETDTGKFFVKVKFEKGSDASTSRFVKEKSRETDAGQIGINFNVSLKLKTSKKSLIRRIEGM